MARTDRLLDDGISDESDSGSGYDSEAAEQSKSKSTRSTALAKGSKRRKLSHSPSASEDEDDEDSFATAADIISPVKSTFKQPSPRTVSAPAVQEDNPEDNHTEPDYEIKSASSAVKRKAPTKTKSKESKPGVIYMSSLPPYLKPSALKHLLAQRGFEPVTRLFLTPASKHAHSSKKNSRQLYTEGWIEFASKQTAKQCAEALNAQQVGGKKGGFYYDDLWNMKYLRGMGWEELMEGVREEKREAEGRRDEERRIVERETREFLEGVEVAKRQEGMKRKRRDKGRAGDDGGEGNRPLRDWRQHEVAGKERKGKKVDAVAAEVLSQIF